MLFPTKHVHIEHVFSAPLRPLLARAVIASRASRFAFVDLFVDQYGSFFSGSASNYQLFASPINGKCQLRDVRHEVHAEEIGLQSIQALVYLRLIEIMLRTAPRR